VQKAQAVNLFTLYKVFDTVVSVLDLRKENSKEPEASPQPQQQPPTFADQIEARLTNVVVAALKEAFDRDHARLEMERTHLEEQRRRAEEAVRLELRRQAIDREIGRLRLLAAAGLTGWVASAALLLFRLQGIAPASRGLLILGSLLLLSSVGSAFSAQGIIAGLREEEALRTPASAASLLLLLSGLALTAISLLF
jgi:hypothetical protein